MNSSLPYFRKYSHLHHSFSQQDHSQQDQESFYNASSSNSIINFSNYRLKWRQRKLIVQFSPEQYPTVVPVIEKQEWLVDRLQHSPVCLVKLDRALGEERLQIWVEACRLVQKKAYLRLPAMPLRPQRQHPLSWWLKRQMDWLISVLLVGSLSPIMILISLLLRLESPEPILVREWCVGERGKLFQSLKFRTKVASGMICSENSKLKRDNYEYENSVNYTDLGRWLCKLKLDRLPLLFNVLRGEMSIVGSCPVTLTHAVQIKPELQHSLNLLPGILGIKLIIECSKVERTSLQRHCELNYNQHWSLWWDFKLLVGAIMSLPFVIKATH